MRIKKVEVTHVEEESQPVKVTVCKHQNQAEVNGQIKCLDCNQLT